MALQAAPLEVSPFPGGDSGLTCTACSYDIANFSERLQHYRTEWHRYNVKRRCANLPPITEDDFNSKLVALKQSKVKVELKCEGCSKSFKTQNAYEQHLGTNKHKKISDKLAALALEAAASPLTGPPAIEAESKSAAPLDSTMDSQPSAEQSDAADADAEADDADVEQDGEAIPIGSCLFCSKQFGSVQPSLDHMLKEHGFFIPFVDYIEDLGGLLTYLGEKIGIGHVCIYCNGKGRAAYPSTHAVRQHMNAKFHCKIRLETSEDEDEFLDFYAFPSDDKGADAADDMDTDDAADASGSASKAGPAKQKQQQQQQQVLVIGQPAASALITEEEARRSAGMSGVSGMNDGGELVMNDGRVIGHRALAMYYRQSLRPTALISSLSGVYRALALPGYAQNAAQDRVAQGGFLRKMQHKHMRVGMNANRLQKHYRLQIMI